MDIFRSMIVCESCEECVKMSERTLMCLNDEEDFLPIITKLKWENKTIPDTCTRQLENLCISRWNDAVNGLEQLKTC